MKTPKYPNRSRGAKEQVYQESYSQNNNGYASNRPQQPYTKPQNGNGYGAPRFAKREFMNYNKFSFDRIKRRFNLNDIQKDLFEQIPVIEPSAWLKETMDITSDLPIKTEKARTEFILMPILLELRKRTASMFTIYSGEFFNVEPREGLAGPSDIILSLGTESYSISSPVMSIVQAYKNNIDLGIGKCVAQMIAADIFNEREDNHITTIYGCVTTGEQWLFLRLEGDTIQIHPHRYSLNELPEIIGMLDTMLNTYKEPVV